MTSKTIIFALISFWLAALSKSDVDGPDCGFFLMPCQQYLKHPAVPPVACCAPLIESVKDDMKCVCSVLNNAAILKKYNVTQTDAINLVKACEAKADMSLCNPGSSPNNSTSKEKNAANSVACYFGMSSIIVCATFLL